MEEKLKGGGKAWGRDYISSSAGHWDWDEGNYSQKISREGEPGIKSGPTSRGFGVL